MQCQLSIVVWSEPCSVGGELGVWVEPSLALMGATTVQKGIPLHGATILRCQPDLLARYKGLYEPYDLQYVARRLHYNL